MNMNKHTAVLALLGFCLVSSAAQPAGSEYTRFTTEAQIGQKLEADDVKAFIMEAAKISGVSQAQVEADIGAQQNSSVSAQKIMEPAVQSKIQHALRGIKVAAEAAAWHKDSNLKGFDVPEKKAISTIATDMDGAFDRIAADLTGLTTGAVHNAMLAMKGPVYKKLQSKLPAVVSKLTAIANESRAAAMSALSSKVQLANVLRGSQSRKLRKTMAGLTVQQTAL